MPDGRNFLCAITWVPAFTHGSVRGAIYVEAKLDADMISLLNLTPGIIRKRSGAVHQLIDRSDWVKLLTMQDPDLVAKAGQWIQVCTGLNKGDLGLLRAWKHGEFKSWLSLASRYRHRRPSIHR